MLTPKPDFSIGPICAVRAGRACWSANIDLIFLMSVSGNQPQLCFCRQLSQEGPQALDTYGGDSSMGAT